MSAKGILLVLGAVILHGFTHIFSKLGLNAGADVYHFAAVKMFFSALVVGLIWFTYKNKFKLEFDKKYIKDYAILGFTASGVASILIIIALVYTSPVNATIVQGLYGAATMMLAYFWLRERLSRWFLPLLLIMMVGMYLFSSKGLSTELNFGDWLLLITVPIVAYANVYARHMFELAHHLTVGFGRFFFGVIFLALAALILRGNIPIIWSDGYVWAVASGSFAGLRLICFYAAIKREGPTLPATLLTVAPIVTALGSSFILKETFNLIQLIGFVTVLLTAILMTRLKATYMTPSRPTH
jgi:drug/metabolite transporter (DMT)-like permease